MHSEYFGNILEMHNETVTMCFITGLQAFFFITILEESRFPNKNFIGFLAFQPRGDLMSSI